MNHRSPALMREAVEKKPHPESIPWPAMILWGAIVLVLTVTAYWFGSRGP